MASGAANETDPWAIDLSPPKIQDAHRPVAMHPYSLIRIVQRKLCQPDVAFATTGRRLDIHVENVRGRLKSICCVSNIDFPYCVSRADFKTT